MYVNKRYEFMLGRWNAYKNTITHIFVYLYSAIHIYKHISLLFNAELEIKVIEIYSNLITYNKWLYYQTMFTMFNTYICIVICFYAETTYYTTTFFKYIVKYAFVCLYRNMVLNLNTKCNIYNYIKKNIKYFRGTNLT